MNFVTLFFAAIAVEVASLVLAGRWFGGWTFVALIASFVLGLAVLSGRGIAIVRQALAALQGGQSPTGAIVDGALLVAAGVLLIIPGFASDAVALVLLFPPTRHLVRNRLITRGRATLARHGTFHDGAVPDGDVIDVEATERKPPPPPMLDA